MNPDVAPAPQVIPRSPGEGNRCFAAAVVEQLDVASAKVPV